MECQLCEDNVKPNRKKCLQKRYQKQSIKAADQKQSGYSCPRQAVSYDSVSKSSSINIVHQKQVHYSHLSK